MTEIITVTGNIATDPEQRNVTEGVRVTSFRLASPHRRFDRGSGTWIEQFTNFYTVSAFRGLGEHAFASLRRGDRVVVTGRLRLREWDNGTRSGTTAEIDADAIGHDLLWGTTSYTRAEHRERSAEESGRSASDPAPAATDATGWAIPAASPALVGADAAGPDAGAPGETPF